eukprot:1157934-Pelagomonas_calceolata.AAC.8
MNAQDAHNVQNAASLTRAQDAPLFFTMQGFQQCAFDSLPLNVIAEVISRVQELTDARSLFRCSKLLLAQSREASVQAA